MPPVARDPRDPRLLTISLHEHPVTLWPGTGLPAEASGPVTVGSAVTVALPAATPDAGWLRAFHALVPPQLGEFRRAAGGAKFTVERMLSRGCDGFGGQPSFAA